ncbi:MAG: hypothetical protein N3A01_07005 [Bacteroidales bacterium]|nr:hypothetical protein [Bacteroidales bacterium]
MLNYELINNFFFTQLFEHNYLFYHRPKRDNKATIKGMTAQQTTSVIYFDHEKRFIRSGAMKH